MTMSPTLINAIVETCANTPRGSIEKSCVSLSHQNTLAREALPLLSGMFAKQTLTRLKKALKDSATTTQELALALLATSAGIEAGRATPDIQLVWTGPDTPTATPRDTLPQMLEMIGRAERSILLVTFAAFRVKALMDALREAQMKGIQLMIVLETSEDSAGQLTHAAWKAFPKQFVKLGCIWHWPLAARPRNAKGLPGKLHAKCLVVDQNEILISSANLTEDAMERNIELGIRCSCRTTALNVSSSFQRLAQLGTLKQVC
jgi:phosphatidylserine/phosphatidylglycerophosphate/cardiolipin synthase-like enzyme